MTTERRRNQRDSSILTDEERARIRKEAAGLIDASLIDEVRMHLSRVPEWEQRLTAIEHVIDRSVAEFHGAKKAAVLMASFMGTCLALIGAILLWIVNDKMSEFRQTKEAIAVMQTSIAQIDILVKEIKYIREEQVRNTANINSLLMERRQKQP